ncbi:MAG: hypothetical protein ACXU9J_05510 [Syntrophales bacterium]
MQKKLDGGIIKIDSFTKTNGWSGDSGDYVVDFEANIYYLKVDRSMDYNTLGDIVHQAGEKRTVKGKFYFRKTEKGWKSGGGDCPGAL